MALPSFFFRRLVLLILLVAFSLVSVALPQEACAKGVPTIAKITGPGLTRPIRFSGPEFPAPVGAWKLPALTGAHLFHTSRREWRRDRTMKSASAKRTAARG